MFNYLSPKDLSGMSSAVLFLADFTKRTYLRSRVREEIFGKSLLLGEDFNENTKSAKNRVNPCESVSKISPVRDGLRHWCLGVLVVFDSLIFLYDFIPKNPC